MTTKSNIRKGQGRDKGEEEMNGTRKQRTQPEKTKRRARRKVCY